MNGIFLANIIGSIAAVKHVGPQTQAILRDGLSPAPLGLSHPL
jgi:hypothetical protein